ncbi:putative DNA-3-methyladenine glycosylase [Quillaja saponaria]|uniref:DNA-3-methyladenine glycosylase n=1 Tax=Quillaja saponaria TaxID=32244 RepID=A0AAD7PFI3_QUISA|nr:putative DNA-3-methyladenine glycosylase [Quillaja saponaria]
MVLTRSQTKPISPSQSQLPDFQSTTISIKSTTTVSLNPSSSKISFRARKIRRLTSDTPNNEDPQILTADWSKTKIISSDKKATSDKGIPSGSATVLPVVVKPLTFEGEIDLAIQHLRKSDSVLATLIDSHELPELISNFPPFLFLTRMIVSQQLSDKAAKSIHNRFVTLCGGEASVMPEIVLGLSVQQLREVGLSGAKANYIHDLASKYIDGTLSDSSILEMDDKTLFSKLTMVKGIGPWSVHMFMIFTLHRPDVLPVGDLVVRRGVQRLYGLKELPKPPQMEELCAKWKPFRSVGTLFMYRLLG